MKAAAAAIGFAVLLMLVCPAHAQGPDAPYEIAKTGSLTGAPVRASAETFASFSSFSSGVKLASLEDSQPLAAEPSDTTAATDATAAIGSLVLRPAPGLKSLADRVARVLSLRFGGSAVDVGGPPPPGLLEAVPAGHVALAAEGGRIRLVLGAAFGAFFEASVPFLPPAREPEVRTLALAVEALRDRAMEARGRGQRARVLPPTPALLAAGVAWSHEDARELAPEESLGLPGAALGSERVGGDAGLPSARGAVPAQGAPSGLGARAPAPAAPRGPSAAEMLAAQGGAEGWGLRDTGAGMPAPRTSELQREVEPMVYVRAYGGASLASAALQMGVATGGGLCVRGQCLVLGLESPLPFGPQARATDVRYRYFTVWSGFYSRPFQFGPFAPAASLGFISRVGHFRRDMGMLQGQRGGSLDSDLGVRGTLEASLQVWNAFELTSELGLDYALDRWRIGFGEMVAYRGERAALWAQAGVRFRPY